MNNRAASVVSVVVGLFLVACGGGPGGSSGTRSTYPYKAVSGTGSMTLNSQLAGGCNATSTQTMTFGVGDFCSVSYSPGIGSFTGRLDINYSKAAATGTNSCGDFYCNHATAAHSTSISFTTAEDLPDDPPANMMVTPLIHDLNFESMGDCGAELLPPEIIEAQQVTVGTFMASEFTLNASGQKDLTKTEPMGTVTGTLTYDISIKFQLQPE